MQNGTKIELTREEYMDIVKCLNRDKVHGFSNERHAGIIDANDPAIIYVERVCPSTEDPEWHYFQVNPIPAEYTIVPSPTTKIVVENFKQLEAILNEVARLQREAEETE